jgi:Predicted ATPase (AAA+ superfamily)
MYWIARDLVNRGWPHRSIVYLDFEDVRLMGIRPSDFDSFIKVINEEAKAWNGRVVLLLDEVQNIHEWGRWVRTLLNRGRYLVVVSGSSSRLRASEVSTELRGRYIERLVLPFSFREFLRVRVFKPIT